MRIYFAGPLFNESERVFNLRLTEKLEAKGFQVFLPQRDGVELRQPPYNEMSDEELQKTIFERDRDQVYQADILLFLLDGRVPDEGGCVELGFAYVQKHILKQDKLLIGYYTDMRGGFRGGQFNAMIMGALDYLKEDEEDLIREIDVFRNGRKAIV